jgi:glycosyltransferase involved in cell wall biosynthesis
VHIDPPQLRIAHISATFPPYYAGTGNVCFHNARVLAKRGHDVRVIAPIWPGTIWNPPQVAVHRLDTRIRVGNASILKGVVRRLDNLDLIHLHLPFIGTAEQVALLAKIRRIPLVVTYHNDLIGTGLRGIQFIGYQRLVVPTILGVAQRICVVTQGHAAASKGLGKLVASNDKRLTVMPNGVDTTKFKDSDNRHVIRQMMGIPDEAFVLIFVGALDAAHYFKGLDVLMEAISLSHVPATWLMVVGGGELQSSFEDRADQLGISDRIRFAGPVPNERLPSYLSAADVLVLPSTEVESFGIVLIEAMACNRPVIATSLPGISEVVSNSCDGYLVPPGDSEALADCIRSVIQMDPEKRSAMGAAGRCKVEAEYDWERIGDRLESLYREVLAETRGVP